MRIFIILSILLVFSGIMMNSCTKDSEEDLMGDGVFCADSNISFANNVIPILKANCWECHSSAIATQGIILDNYQDVKDLIDGGYIIPQINHEPGVPHMPYQRAKLQECRIATIEKWVEEGALNN